LATRHTTLDSRYSPFPTTALRFLLNQINATNEKTAMMSGRKDIMKLKARKKLKVSAAKRVILRRTELLGKDTKQEEDDDSLSPLGQRSISRLDCSWGLFARPKSSMVEFPRQLIINSNVECFGQGVYTGRLWQRRRKGRNVCNQTSQAVIVDFRKRGDAELGMRCSDSFR
jgi:hypothetical protein